MPVEVPEHKPSLNTTKIEAEPVKVTTIETKASVPESPVTPSATPAMPKN